MLRFYEDIFLCEVVHFQSKQNTMRFTCAKFSEMWFEIQIAELISGFDGAMRDVFWIADHS